MNAKNASAGGTYADFWRNHSGEHVAYAMVMKDAAHLFSCFNCLTFPGLREYQLNWAQRYAEMNNASPTPQQVLGALQQYADAGDEYAVGMCRELEAIKESAERILAMDKIKMIKGGKK